MKNAYNQGLECDQEEENGDDGISPKDVGHNIYILAHQVGFVWGVMALGCDGFVWGTMALGCDGFVLGEMASTKVLQG